MYIMIGVHFLEYYRNNRRNANISAHYRFECFIQALSKKASKSSNTPKNASLLFDKLEYVIRGHVMQGYVSSLQYLAALGQQSPHNT